MKTYPELIQELFQLNLFSGHKDGLVNMARLNQILDEPDRSYKIIHVAGTNGKGSVSTKIAKALQLSGYRVGLFTSPHIASFRERVLVDDHMISKEDTARLLTQLFALCQQHLVPATFFETATLLAFLYFKEKQVDYVVLEAGLGGRLDSTNIIHPILTVITSIGLDHSEILGATLQEIAREKAGIIKKEIPVVIGPSVPFAIIEEYTKKHHCLLKQIKGTFQSFDEENSATAREALKFLPVTDKAVMHAIQIRPPCRFQIFHYQGKTIILDVAHNPQGLKELFKALKQHYPGKEYVLLFGFSKTKDLPPCLDILANYGKTFFPVTTDNGRCFSVEEMVAGLTAQNLDPSQIRVENSMAASFVRALTLLKTEELLVVCGTFYIMKTIRTLLGLDQECDEP